MTTNSKSQLWGGIADKIAPEIIIAPKTGGDPHNSGTWPTIPRKVISYLERNIIGEPWGNTFVLIAAIMAAHRYEKSSILGKITMLHNRFRNFFQVLNIQKMDDWHPSQYIPAYLQGNILLSDTQNTRQAFLEYYLSANKLMLKWLKGLPAKQQKIYNPFILPAIDEKLLLGLNRSSEVLQQQRQTRKAETDAVLPYFAEIRAEAHFRYNRIMHLRQAYQNALKSKNDKGLSFPVSFSYEEGGDPDRSIPAKERLTFRIWDRQSFVLAHADSYPSKTVKAARCGCMDALGSNHIFLELVGSSRLIGDAPTEGFWFEDLFRRGVMGLNGRTGSEVEVETKLEWLKSWGYNTAPFYANVGGLLTWPIAERTFLACAQKRISGLIIPIEAIYGAAMFGLMAVDFISISGARINEVMQIRLSKDCLVRLELPAPPGAKDQSPRIRYALRLVPKGEKRNIPQDYFISEETVRLLVKTAKMLSDHYKLPPGAPLPIVEYDKNDGRSDRFGKAPYLFQYNNLHLSGQAISSCMRFLLHGMIFKTREGKMVVLKSHLLRHAFATHAVQVEKIPIDIVGAWLHQKNLDITDYYSKPTESIIAEASDQFLARISANINVNEILLRTPDELQTLYDDARGKAGTLADVIGGQCVSHGYCAAKFACVGCAGKVPDPAKRYQIEKHKSWAQEQVNYAIQEGLNPEAERMKQLIRDCDNEIAEIDLIEAYREDEKREVKIRIEEQR